LAAHDAVPRTQPSLADTNVTDCGSKPAGTGPPGGPATGAADGEASGDADGVPAEAEEDAWDELERPAAGCAGFCPHPASAATTTASAGKAPVRAARMTFITTSLGRAGQ